ncbi:MAG: hypothetical protein ACI802_002791 [Candidatus Paceibacteria bacterium]|jgi:hypothetical protein
MKKVPPEKGTRFIPAREGTSGSRLDAQEMLLRSFGITCKTDNGDCQILKLSVTAEGDVIHDRSSDETN